MKCPSHYDVPTRTYFMHLGQLQWELERLDKQRVFDINRELDNSRSKQRVLATNRVPKINRDCQKEIYTARDRQRDVEEPIENCGKQDSQRELQCPRERQKELRVCQRRTDFKGVTNTNEQANSKKYLNFRGKEGEEYVSREAGYKVCPVNIGQDKRNESALTKLRR